MLSNYNLIVFAHKSNYLLLKNKYFFKKISYFFTNKTKVFHSLFRNACIYYKTQQSIQIQFIIRKVTFFFNLLKKNTFFLLHFIQFHIHFFNFQIKKSHFVQKKNLTLHFIRLDSIIFITFKTSTSQEIGYRHGFLSCLLNDFYRNVIFS